MVDTLPVMGRPSKEETENTRIAKSIMRKVRVISASMGITAPDYLNQVLAPIVTKKHAEIVAKLAKEESKAKD